MLLSALLLAAAPPPRAGTLTLDARDAVITARIGEATLRLRVDLDQRDVVELTPAAAARTGLPFEGGFDADLGGIVLPGRQAAATLAIDCRARPVAVSTHTDGCCDGADGAVGPGDLPYATIRFVRTGAAPATTLRYKARIDGDDGITMTDGAVAVRLSLAQPVTIASKAAGVRLADAHDGRFAGPYAKIPGPFGVARPVRPVAFARPFMLLGRPVDRVLVRTGDFGGGLAMPEDRATGPSDIIVRQRTRRQRDWPVVTLGRDLLAPCAEIAFHVDAALLDLACPAGGAGGVR